MIKVSPFIQTTGSERFKQFLSQPFTIDMLYPVFNDKSTVTLFDGWRGKDMVNWHKFTNDDKFVLEFYPNHYIIRKDVANAIKYMLSNPKTINDFINDMDRHGVQIYWTQWIDENFEPKECLDNDDIKAYFVDLLTKMKKSHELL